MPPSSEKRTTPYNSQARTVIAHVLQYFERERDNKGPLLDVKKVSERVAAACDISLRTLGRIRVQLKQGISDEARTNEADPETEDVARATDQTQGVPDTEDVASETDETHALPQLCTPRRKKSFRSVVTDMDDFQKTAIRNHVLQYYKRKEVPTLRKLKSTLLQANLFKGCIRTLAKVLKSLGFKWKKLDNRKILIEKPSVALQRCRFLRKIRDVDIKNVVFLDETWVNANISKDLGWTDGSVKCSVNAPLGKGKRLIVCHAGGYNGWINSPPLIFQSRKTVDYHEEMNSEVFEGWFFEVLLKSIPAGSTIIMDNAPYHSRIANKAPTSGSRKSEMIEWLTARNVIFTPDMRKPELYNLIKLRKPQVTAYEIDKRAAQLGFKIIRLPPYHCNYNPIELVWANLKKYVSARNSTFKLSDVQNLFMEAVTSFSAEDWRKCVEHVKKDIDSDWVNEGLDDVSVQELIINLAPGDSDDSEWDSDDDSDFGVSPLD